MENAYVISVKRVRDYQGDELPVEKQYFEYFQYDRYSGSMSTGYPCFGYECHAKHFASVEEALEQFNKDFDALKLTENPKYFDLNTLAVRKVVFKTKHKLQWNDNNVR